MSSAGSDRENRHLKRSPDWRWRRANDLVAGVGRRNADDDPPIIRAVGYLHRLQSGEPPASCGTIHRAFKIYQTDSLLRWKLEALLLARESSRVIANDLDLPREVVKEFASLFYDFRSRQVRVFAPLIPGYSPITGIAETDLATLLKVAAARYGRAGFERVLAVSTGEGRERFTAEQIEEAALYVEELRIPLTRAEQWLQIESRHQAEDAGLPASAYYRRRVSRVRGLEEDPCE